MKFPIRFNVLYAIILLAIFSSCHSEKKIANSFISSHDKIALYTTFSANWDLFMIKPQGKTKADIYARQYFPYRTYFLKNDGTAHIDSVFKNSLFFNLDASSFESFTDANVHEFFKCKEDKYIIEFVQLYVEEKTLTVNDTFYFTNTNIIKFDTAISCVDLCFWLRINPVNDSFLASPLLYASFSLADYFEGRWEYDYETGNYFYKYDFTEFKKEDIDALFEYAGEKIAEYIYDYFLNMYLYKQMKSKPKAYYSWNGRYLHKAGQNRFIFMKND